MAIAVFLRGISLGCYSSAVRLFSLIFPCCQCSFHCLLSNHMDPILIVSWCLCFYFTLGSRYWPVTSPETWSPQFCDPFSIPSCVVRQSCHSWNLQTSSLICRIHVMASCRAVYRSQRAVASCLPELIARYRMIRGSSVPRKRVHLTRTTKL